MIYKKNVWFIRLKESGVWASADLSLENKDKTVWTARQFPSKEAAEYSIEKVYPAFDKFALSRGWCLTLEDYKGYFDIVEAIITVETNET